MQQRLVLALTVAVVGCSKPSTPAATSGAPVATITPTPAPAPTKGSAAGPRLFPGDVPAKWLLSRTDRGTAFVVLEYAGKKLAIGEIGLDNVNDPQAANLPTLGCDIANPTNHPADSVLLCGETPAHDHYSMRAQIKKGEVVVSAAIAKPVESDLDFSHAERLATAKIDGQALVAELIVGAPQKISDRDDPCASDDNCKSGLQCVVVRTPTSKGDPNSAPDYACQ